MKIRDKIKNTVGCVIARWLIGKCGGYLDVKRKGGATQTIRVFSTQAHERIVKPAFACGGVFYTQQQLNLAIENTIKAVRNCGEDSDCSECFLHIKEDDCVMNHVLD